MTISNVLEGIYESCVYEIDVDTNKSKILEKITNEVSTQWPEIEGICGISVENNGHTFHVVFSDELLREFFEKYPEALI